MIHNWNNRAFVMFVVCCGLVCFLSTRHNDNFDYMTFAEHSRSNAIPNDTELRFTKGIIGQTDVIVSQKPKCYYHQIDIK